MNDAVSCWDYVGVMVDECSMCIEHWQNDTDMGKLSTWSNTLPTATSCTKMTLEQVEWTVQCYMLLELLLHCEHITLANKFLAFSMAASNGNILFCVVSYLKTVLC